MDKIKRTPLYEAHLAAGATMVDFGGWDMPIQYATGIVAEHLYDRKHCGIFDVSHMGRLIVEGPERVAFLQKACASLPTVRVVHSDGYVADYAKENGCDIIIKGFRDDRDLAYEKPQACYALSHGGTPTLLLPAAPALAGISYSEVRLRLRDGEP